MFGSHVTSFDYKDIAGIETQIGAWTGYVRIATAGYEASGVPSFFGKSGKDRDVFKMANCIPINRRSLSIIEPYLAQLRELAANAKEHVHSNGHGMVADLERLVTLKESGALSDVEFQQAKQKVVAWHFRQTLFQLSLVDCGKVVGGESFWARGGCLKKLAHTAAQPVPHERLTGCSDTVFSATYAIPKPRAPHQFARSPRSSEGTRCEGIDGCTEVK